MQCRICWNITKYESCIIAIIESLERSIFTLSSDGSRIDTGILRIKNLWDCIEIFSLLQGGIECISDGNIYLNLFPCMDYSSSYITICFGDISTKCRCIFTLHIGNDFGSISSRHGICESGTHNSCHRCWITHENVIALKCLRGIGISNKTLIIYF